MADISLIGAFIAGLVSFLSPCILPIVPFYLCYLAGQSLSQLTQEGVLSDKARRQTVLMTVWFAIGVISVFVALGASASLLGQWVSGYFDVLRWGAAGIIAVMGLHFLGVFQIDLFNRHIQIETSQTRVTTWRGAFVMGFAFAFGWTPCVGPVLFSILFLAADNGTATRGVVLLFSYAIGMTLPFVIAALFVGPFVGWVARFRSYLGLVQQVMGLSLLLFAVLIAMDAVSHIAQWLLVNVAWFSGRG